MDISLVSLPVSEPRLQAKITPTDQKPAQTLRIFDPPIRAEQRGALIGQTTETDPRVVTDPKQSVEQTLKPYGTLMLPYRGAASSVSVVA